MENVKKAFWEILKFSLVIAAFILLFIDCFSIKLHIENTLVMIVVTELLPMVLTILSIALSIPSEKVLGINAIEFRRMRNSSYNYTFTFFEMILIVISIFVLMTVANILNLNITVWVLDGISVIYAILFILQEIPILLKDEKKLFAIVNKCWPKNKNKSSSGGLSDGSSLYKVLSYILMKQGIKETYKSLCDGNNGSELLVLLMGINNSFLTDYKEREGYIKITGDGSYYDLDIIEAFNISINSLSDLVSLNSDFNIYEIDNKFNRFYYLKRHYELLRYLANQFGLVDSFEANMKHAIMSLMMNKYSPNKEVILFCFKILNYFIVTEASEDRFDFLYLLRDSDEIIPMSNEYSIAYFIFLLIFFHYLLNVDKRVKDITKIKLQDFLNSGSRSYNYLGDTWYSMVHILTTFSDFKDIVDALPILIDIFRGSDRNEPWYFPEERTSWSSSDGEMNLELVLGCWLELLVYRYNMKFDEKILDEKINNLSDEDKSTLSRVIYAKLLNNAGEYEKKPGEGLFLKTFRMGDDERLYSNMEAIEYFKKKHKEIPVRCSKEINNRADIKNEDLEKYNKKLIELFEANKVQTDFYDGKLDLKDSKKLYFALQFEASGDIENQIKLYGDTFSKSLNMKIYNDFKSEIKPIEFNPEEINKLISERKLDRYNGSYSYQREKLNLDGLKIDRPFLPGVAIWKDGSIRCNARCDKTLTKVRRLTDSEINDKIEREYKVGNGLYRFSISHGQDYAFLSKEEIYELVANKFFGAILVFDWKLEFDKDNIFWIKDENEGD